jgi:multiple sugar transport system substrate-binding protein
VNWASYWVEGVSNKSKNIPAAWELVKYITSHDTAVKLYTAEASGRAFGEPYARVDLASNLAGDKYVEAYLSQAASARSFPLASRTFDNGLNDKLIKYLEDAINSVNNGASPTDALKTMASGFQQIFNQFGLVSASQK